MQRPIILTGFVLATLRLLSLSATGCSPSQTEVRADLERYLRNSRDWAPTEAETARCVQRILATQFVDEAEVRRQIAADSPRVAAHIERIAAFEPLTAPLRKIHASYVHAWRDLLKGYQRILHGLDTGDAADLAAGRQALARWRAAIVSTAEHLRELAEATGAHRGTAAPKPQRPLA